MTKYKPTHVRKIEIAQEYGMPFADVIRHLAEQGLARKEAVRESYFRRRLFAQECDHIDAEWDNTYNTLYLCDGVRATIKQHCSRTGQSASAARNRLLMGHPPEVAFDPRSMAEIRAAGGV